MIAWTIDRDNDDDETKDSTIVSRKLVFGPFFLTYIMLLDSYSDCLYVVGIEGTNASWTFRSW